MRSLLLTSCRDDASLAAASASGADALLIDLASLAAAERARARERVAAFLARAPWNAERPRRIVRIAALGDPAIDADLDAVMPAAPDGVAPSACRDGADVERLAAKLAVCEAEFGLIDGATQILAFVAADAAALLSVASFVGRSARLCALAWDPAALLADLGAVAPYGTKRQRRGPARLARELTLIAAVAARAAPIDAAFPETDDDEGLGAEAREAREDGFVGKVAVNANQVAIINQIFAR